MANNRFFTVLIIPEKTAQVRRIVIPSWAARTAIVSAFFVVFLATVMILNYWYVMTQVTENRELKLENRRLKQQVQIFDNKLDSIEGSLERIKTFSTRLRIITNIEDRDSLIQSLNQKLPEASKNIAQTTPPSSLSTTENPGSSTGTAPNPPSSSTSAAPTLTGGAPETSSAAPFAMSLGSRLFGDPEARAEAELASDFRLLDEKLETLHQDGILLEQVLQDQYELLADQRSFLSALPTRKPAIGYFTSGFGIRRSPYGGREKMHEGLDIANFVGTPIIAPADGTVAFAESKAGYGQTLILDHGYGLETWYGHTKKIFVAKGQKVKRGEQVALLGNSGRSTGPHLHYEVRINGTPVDPLSYILEN